MTKGLDKSKAQSKKPCDIVDVLIKDDPVTPKTDGKPEIAEPGKVRQISFASPHTNPDYPKDTLEVCSDFEGSSRNAKIDIVVKNFAKHSGDHPFLTVKRAGEQVLREVVGGSKKVEVYATKRELDPGSVSSFLSYIFVHYFNPGFKGVPYQISVDTCGHRLKSADAVGAAALNLLVYPYDQYKLTFQLMKGKKKHIVPAKDLEWGAYVKIAQTKKGNGVFSASGYKKKTIETAKGKDTWESSWDGRNAEWSPEKKKSALEKRAFEFQRNGVEDKNSVKLNDLVENIEKLNECIKNLSENILKFVPQAGFKFEFSAEFLAGHCNLAWGWQKAKVNDPRVFFGYEIGVELSIAKISLTLSFGVDVVVAEAKAELTIEGEVTAGGGFKQNAPGPLKAVIDGTGTIDAKAVATASAGIGWLSVSAQVGIKTGINIESSLEISRAGISVTGKWGFSGIAWWAMSSGSGVADEQVPEYHEIVAPCDWGEFAYPEGAS